MVRLQRLRRRDPYEGVRLLPTRCCHLYPGSKFKGKQQSGTNSYDVVVDIKVTSTLLFDFYSLDGCCCFFFLLKEGSARRKRKGCDA